MKKICIVSGGMDSITLLHDIVNQFGNKDILAISFDYGSKHSKFELAKAVLNCKKLKVEHKIINLRKVFSNLNSALLKGGKKIPEGYYANKNMKQTVIPFRNGILLSIAVAIADNEKANTVFYGAHAGDHDIYPDCRKEFVDAINQTATLGTYNKVKIKAPYWNIDKVGIIKKGIKLKVDYSQTHTCYSPDKKGKSCGKCGSCVERTLAFIANDLQDPIYTKQEWEKAKQYALKQESNYKNK